MAISGLPPKPDGQRRRHAAPAHGWTEIERTPFAGRPLPQRPGGGRWPRGTAETWRAWSRMPHCSLWTESDWRFAVESLAVAAAFYETGTAAAAAELRIRQAAMGCTLAGRQGLRLRYVPAGSDGGHDASITSLDEFRNL